MKRKRHTAEEIIRKLREVEQMEAAGQPVAQICQKLEISVATLARWRSQFRGMGDAEIKRLKELEEENRRLKKMYIEEKLKAEIAAEYLAKK